ncbi:acetolactate decarboxylase [Mycobacterium hodleri]|uniref:Alpha-acetolactate decarboxylase n=1 Tax=Mycolicibacterium hodleri TaxID=49897 RepID=A0A544W5K1_9MYCO|nr:acetolactate decarboxylase [Mycolicibacterium hodleri]TQR87508.1 acetolactate decarboxylase [Mycolicibacterium hodleri]
MTSRHSALDQFATWARKVVAHHGETLTGDPHSAEVFQFSTMSALLDGVYDGDITIEELLRHGDFGLGTFNRLDGEMIILDGVCYHLRADGSATVADPADRTPFAAVTHFTPSTTLTVDVPTSRADVLALIDQKVESHNLIHAIRVTGALSNVHTRTVKAQTPPYPPLTEASDGQAVKTFERVDGVLVGFRTPEFEQGISVAGYHLHFLDAARTSGGHVLDFTLDSGDVEISTASELHLRLPTSGPFLHADLAGEDVSAQIHHAEGGD